MSWNGTLEGLIQEAEHLHTAPGVAQTLLRLTKEADFDIQEVVACLERDPALSARLLRMLHSSRFGLRKPVKNLRHAVMLLGARTLRLITMTFSIVEVFSRGPAHSLYRDYWRQSMTMSIAAMRLAKRTEEGHPDDAYTAGLLAHLGTLLYAQVQPDTYLPLFKGAPSGDELVTAEREAFGFDHAQLGARLLEQWEFPEELSEAVRDHHDPETENPLAKLLRAGDLLADVLWKPQTSSLQVTRDWLVDQFGLNFDDFIELAKSCSEEVTLEAEIYGIQLENLPDTQKLLEAARTQYLEVSLNTALDLDSLTTAMEGPMGFE